MSESLTQQTEQAPADAPDADGIDAAAEAFAAMGQPDQQAQPEQNQAEPDPEPEGESDTEADEAEPEAEEPTEELAEVEYEGKTYKVPPELEKALLRQSDYSRKMNEASATEKAYKARLETLEGIEQVAEKRAEVLAEIKQIDEQIKRYEGVNWAEAKQQDPAGAALAAVELLQLQQARQRAEMAAKDADGELRQSRTKVTLEQIEARNKVLDKELPGWNGEVGLKLTAYADSKGIPPQKLATITDASMLVALNKARLYDELQAAKPALKAKAASAAPVTKPGAPRKADPKSTALTAHRKSGSIDSAAAAFLALG